MITFHPRGAGHRRPRSGRAVAALLLCALASGAASAQGETSGGAWASPTAGGPENEPGTPTHELHLARLVYTHGVQASWGPGRAWWRTVALSENESGAA